MAIDIRLYFDCASKETYVSDYTNYESNDFPAGLTVSSSGSLFDPNNTSVFLENPLISVNVNQFPNNSNSFPLPTLLGSSGNVVPGNYSFNYTNTYTWENDLESLQALEFGTDYVRVPNVNLSTLWVVGNSFTISGATETQNNGTFTITDIQWSSNNNQTYIFVAADTFVSSGGEQDLSALITLEKVEVIYSNKVYTYTNCINVTPCVTANYDCTSTPFGNITFENSTTMPTGVVATSSDFTIYYPNGLDFSASPNPGYNDENPIIANSVNSVYISTLATGTWSAKLVLNTSQTQNDGLILINSSSVVKEFNVSCTSNMCGLSSCLTKLKDRHISYLKSSSVSPLQQYVDNVQLLYTMAKEAQACGDKNTYEKYIAEIFEVVKQTDTSCGCGCSGSCSGSCSCGDCSSDCGCGETGPTWVNNTGININSLLEDLADVPAQIAALEASVGNLITDVGDLNSWTGIENWQEGAPSFYEMFETLQSSTSNLVPEVEGNTLDISILQAEVADLQEQVANLGASTSEVSVYELMTNDGSKKSVWNAIDGVASGSLNYVIVVAGNVTSNFTATNIVSFYNPTVNAWFMGEVVQSTFSGGNTNIEIIYSSLDYPNGASWQDSNGVQFPVYKGDLNTSQYNFQTSLTLENDAYWKLEDSTYKYWSKIKASFVINEPNQNAADIITPFSIKNSTSNKTIYLRDLPCGSFVDLELSFEKQWNGSAYNTVTLIDAKYNTGTNISLSVDSELLFGGYSGFNPMYLYGINLYDTPTNQFELSAIEDNNSLNTQDIYSSSGVENKNRLVSRYSHGPSYPNSTQTNFFNGDESEVIVFNFDNINITLLNIEQSFGKMPVSVA
jgi:hypothetical protein